MYRKEADIHGKDLDAIFNELEPSILVSLSDELWPLPTCNLWLAHASIYLSILFPSSFREVQLLYAQR